jgi:hypothetical protein
MKAKCDGCGVPVGQAHTADCPTLTTPPAPRRAACDECGALLGELHAETCSKRG